MGAAGETGANHDLNTTPNNTLPVSVKEHLCHDRASCRCALNHFIGVCLCVFLALCVCVFVLGVLLALDKRCLCFCGCIFSFSSSFFLAFSSKSNGTVKQIICSYGCRDASPVHVETTVAFIPLSSHQSVSRSIICQSVLQASGRFFPPQPETAGEKLLPGTSPSVGRRRAFVLGCVARSEN